MPVHETVVHRFAHAADLFAEAAALFSAWITEDAAAKGGCSIALSGGNTPAGLYRHLAAEPYRSSVPWEGVDLFWGDERLVPPDDPHSNQGLAYRLLIGPLGIAAGKIHPVPTVGVSPESAAQGYESELLRFFGGPPSFDIALLGLGADGHTASLFPGGPLLADDRVRWAAAAEAPPGSPLRDRITLTLSSLNRARRALFLAAGPDKVAAAGRALNPGNEPPPPAALVHPREKLVWLLADEAP
jgi:6-phosphogluconolactonase